ncbi:MAG: MFS transporter [Acidobacteria bacterium]|nr:MAG: MFS transporter [Acidobacteriota bacterium]REK03287.1 MAG: MFS transporter [Acidobacteriota bacterium]
MLEKTQLRLALRRSVGDAALFGAMVGCGESYFLAAAVALRASALEVALVVSLPLFLGSLGPMLALGALGRFTTRRPLVVGAAVLQGLNLVALAVLALSGDAEPAWLIASACLHQVFGMFANTAWSSWYGDLVPMRLRGRYFAQRNRATQTALFLGLALSGVWLDWISGGQGVDAANPAVQLGFAAIFCAAGLFRLGSAGLLAASPEPRFVGLATVRQGTRYFRGGRGRRARRVLALGGLMQLTTYVASPFFIPFMLDDLSFDYIEFTIATAAVVAAKLWFLPAWGKQIDRFGAAAVYRAAVLMVALVPLPWLVINDLWQVALAQAMSGAAWACYELAFFTVLVDATYRRTRPYVFAAQNIFNGTGQILGALIGAALTGPLGLSLRVIFGVSTALRLAAAAGMLPLLPKEPHRHHPDARAHRIVLRAIGFRANGGIALRPVRWMTSEARGSRREESEAE